jgi:hypothetical protein
VIIREDLPRGTLGAQIAHAARESCTQFKIDHSPLPIHVVVLAARCETHLLELEARLRAGGVPHFAMREPDPPLNGAITAIGLPPQPKTNLKKFLSSFPKLKEESSYVQRQISNS